MESTEGPTVSIQIPREWAEELLRSLATALEVEDMGDEPDELGMPHMEPDEDDLGGASDFDADDLGAPDELDFGNEEDDDGEEEFPAGDLDDDEDEPDDEDDDDVEEEAVDFSGGRDARPGTAYNESAFSKLAKKLGNEKGVTNPAGLAASIGRKKLGKKAFDAKAAAGRRKK